MSGSAFHSDAVILAGRQGALEEVEPVLPPIRPVLVDIGRRAEDLALDRLRRIGLDLGTRCGAVRRRDQCLAVEAAFPANRCPRRRVGVVALPGPDAAQQREGELAGVAAALLGRHDSAGGEIARHRKMLGVDVELDAEEIAPALELDEVIGLALLRPLADRQAARDREDLAVVAWFVALRACAQDEARFPSASHLILGEVEGYGHALRHAGRSRSARRMILPVVVIGNASMNSTSRGYSCAASLVLTKSWISRASSAEGAQPGFRTRNALTSSVRTGSGTPTAAARATAGCFIRQSSISPGPMR